MRVSSMTSVLDEDHQSQQTSLAQTACMRCREHKLRCSRELTQCARCASAGTTCTYPQPPDRKSIAVQREQRKRQAADAAAEYGSNLVLPADKRKRQGSCPASQSSKTQHETLDEHTVTVNLNELDSHLHHVLQNAYFSCTFNASVAFHRPTFEADFARNAVPEHCLQAMYAMATIFLCPESGLGQKHRLDISRLGDLRDLSEKWAIAAGRTALQDIDQPTMAAVQTCQILTMFWCSRGNYRRNTMFAGIAYRATRMILMEAETFNAHSGKDTSSDTSFGNTSWLEMERLRRCFWASWQIVCINSDSYATGVSTDPQTTALTLPVSEDSYASGVPEKSTSLREALLLMKNNRDSRHKDAPKNNSLFAEVLKLVSLWARVRDHMDARRVDAENEPWNNAFLIQNELTQWKNQLDTSLEYSKRNLFEQLVVKQRPLFVLLNALYHQCCLVLQASLVPSLSGAYLPDNVPSAAVRISAEVALHHAKALSRLGADLMSLEWNPARLAPFVGYCMYVSATVHLTIIVRDASLAEKARSDLAASLALLKVMKPYWIMLEQLWSRISHLYEIRMSKQSSMSTPTVDTAYGSASLRVDESNDSDAEANGVNNLLKDSVLQFSIRKLAQASSPNSQGRSPSTSALEEVLSHTSEDRLASILEAGDGYSQRAQQRHGSSQESRPQADISQSAYPFPWQELRSDDASNGMLGSPGTSLLTDNSSDNLFAVLGNGTSDSNNEMENWWQLDLATSDQTEFPFSDFFGMSLARQ